MTWKIVKIGKNVKYFPKFMGGLLEIGFSPPPTIKNIKSGFTPPNRIFKQARDSNYIKPAKRMNKFIYSAIFGNVPRRIILYPKKSRSGPFLVTRVADPDEPDPNLEKKI